MYIVSLFLVIKLILYLCRNIVKKSLTNFMNQIIYLRDVVHTLDLLKALPLLHFLRGDYDRYEQLVLPPADVIKWTEDPTLKLSIMRSTIHSETK